MNLNKIGNTFCFTEIGVDDIKFSNLRGSETRSVYNNSENPGHSISIWLTDDMANILRAEGAFVTDKVVETDDGPIVKRHMKLNVFPTVLTSFVLNCGDRSEKLDFESLGQVDDAYRCNNIENLKIGFHLYVNKYKTISASITNIWLYIKDDTKMTPRITSEDVDRYFAGI